MRYLGCSNFAGWMIADAHWTAATRHLEPFVSAQNEWNLLNRGVEDEVVPACARFGLGVIPYFPLASGLLTGKVRRGEQPPEHSRLSADHFAHVLHDDNFDKLDRLEGWGKEHGRTLTEVALSWLASQPIVSSVIAGATSPEQVRGERRGDSHRSQRGRRRGGRTPRRRVSPPISGLLTARRGAVLLGYEKVRPRPPGPWPRRRSPAGPVSFSRPVRTGRARRRRASSSRSRAASSRAACPTGRRRARVARVTRVACRACRRARCAATTAAGSG